MNVANPVSGAQDSVAGVMKRVTSALLATALAASATYAQPPADAVPMSVTGRAVLTYLDEFETGNSQLRYAIEQQQTRRRFRLNFEGEPPANLRSGQPITVNGRGKGRNIYLAADGMQTPNAPVALAQVANGEQDTLVMVANFTDVSVSCSVPEVQALMFTDANSQSVDDLYQEMSYGNVSLTGDVAGPYEISASSSGCDLDGWADEADAAATSAGYDPSSYSRRLYVMPQNSCPASGVADLGGDNSRAWVFRCSVADIYAHELGHNIGMHHAGTPQAHYGDTTDVMGMGLGKLRHVNGPHKEQM
ncbi:MAG TPA: hypothetical protein VKQ06_13505, partial [Gammaproteobacteria bacterium]|nr:hypothetical protein [Gammaproteobacteria bacterium]